MVPYIAAVRRKDFRKAALTLNEERDELYKRKAFLEEQWTESMKKTGYNECGEKCRFFRKRKCATFGRMCILLASASTTGGKVSVQQYYEQKGQLLFQMEIVSPIDEFGNRQRVERELKKVREDISKVEEKLMVVAGSASLEK
ncbi:MAG: hypothetical protein PHN74_00575 [Candidatus Pacebacteria bacterium]|nr:hypothetical protein [Candidatus Paceibacterota bacterium]